MSKWLKRFSLTLALCLALLAAPAASSTAFAQGTQGGGTQAQQENAGNEDNDFPWELLGLLGLAGLLGLRDRHSHHREDINTRR